MSILGVLEGFLTGGSRGGGLDVPETCLVRFWLGVELIGPGFAKSAAKIAAWMLIMSEA